MVYKHLKIALRYLYKYYQKFHNTFYRGKIEADQMHGTEIGVIPKNQQQEMYDIFKTITIYYMFKFVRNQLLIQNNE